MAFSKRARGESLSYDVDRQRRDMYSRGWCDTFVGQIILRGLRIDHAEGIHVYCSMTTFYAPAWVELVRLQCDGGDGLLRRLQSLKDDADAREMLCAEAHLDLDMPGDLRSAAGKYVELSRRARLKGNK